MKKETQKNKWTKKTKERGERVKNNSYGITLIALVITVIVDFVFYDKNKKYRNLADSPIIDINL